jgi:hypothetical protein
MKRKLRVVAGRRSFVGWLCTFSDVILRGGEAGARDLTSGDAPMR